MYSRAGLTRCTQQINLVLADRYHSIVMFFAVNIITAATLLATTTATTATTTTTTAAKKLPNNDIKIYNENIKNIDTIRNSIIKQANFPDNNNSNNHNNNNGNNTSTNTTNNNNSISNKKSPTTNWVIKPKTKRNSRNSHTSYNNNNNNDQHNKYSSSSSSSSSSYRRSHNKIAKSCLRSSDCDTSIGESCYFLYEGCSAGHCMCQNDYRHNGIIDRCRKKFINESCTRNGDCHAEMICAPAIIINNMNSNLDNNFDNKFLGSSSSNNNNNSNNNRLNTINNLNNNSKVCQCPEKTIASDDGSFCLVGQLHRLLGTKCQPSTHECLQKAAYGYTRTDTECHSEKNICTCVEGFRKERMACLKRDVGEAGCRFSYQCEGGSVCNDGVCICPTGFEINSRYPNKCVSKKAVKNLKLGMRCNEIDSVSYCEKSLICHRCQPSHPYTCVRFSPQSHFSYLKSVAASDHSPHGRPAIIATAPTTIIIIIIITLYNHVTSSIVTSSSANDT